MDVADLEKMLTSLFLEADQDRSGALDFAEFQQLMATADIGLTAKEVELLVAEVDEDSNGQITYSEFVPLAVEVIQTMRLKQKYDYAAAEERLYLREAAGSIIGLTPQQVAGLVEAAPSSGGLLSRVQVKTLLRNPQLGLSKQQTNIAAVQVDYDGGGMVAVATLAPALYGILETVVVQALEMQNIGEVGAELTRLFEFYDKEGTGFLDPRVMKQTLLQGFPFLTRLQANALVSDGDVPSNAEGSIAWREYLPKLTAIIKGMGDPDAIRERAELSARAEFQPVELMSGKDHDQMNELLTNLFKEADKDGNGSLDHAEFRECLSKTDFGFTAGDIDDLILDFDANGDGKISYDEFVTLAYEILVHLARERKIMNSMVHIENEVYM